MYELDRVGFERHVIVVDDFLKVASRSAEKRKKSDIYYIVL